MKRKDAIDRAVKHYNYFGLPKGRTLENLCSYIYDRYSRMTKQGKRKFVSELQTELSKDIES